MRVLFASGSMAVKVPMVDPTGRFSKIELLSSTKLVGE